MYVKFRKVNYHFFWDGPLSNWDESPFELDGIWFNCAEQYMMFQKAIKFCDLETARMIMAVPHPYVQKALGREVRNYNDDVWAACRYEIVKKGLRAKFKQNPIHGSYLKSMLGITIVEASPEDRIWGIGYYESEAVQYIAHWGQNLLGKMLMEVRDELWGQSNIK